MIENTPQIEQRTPVARHKPLASGAFLQNVKLVTGVFLMLFCSALIVTYISEIITGTTLYGVASALGLIVFLAGLGWIGWMMVKSRLTEKNALRELREEQLILTRARANAGSLTVGQTALECQFKIADTKRAFERLSLLGVCQVDVTEQGELCYRFPSLIAQEQDGVRLNVQTGNIDKFSTIELKSRQIDQEKK